MENRSLLILLLSIFFISCNEKENKNNRPVAEDKDTSVVVSEEVEEEVSDTLLFLWETELCDVKGYYLSTQYKKSEIQNTYNLMTRMLSGLTTTHSAFRPEGIEKIDIEGLTKEYNDLIAYLDNCQVVDVPFWKNFVIEQKKSLKKMYELQKMCGKAYTDPSVLLDNQYIDKNSDCNEYAEALNAEDPQVTYDAWKKWIEESKKNNGNPEAYVQHFYEKYNSPDRLLYARVDLITFAWWNCVNQYIDYPDYSIMMREFEKLFLRVEQYNCEEP